MCVEKVIGSDSLSIVPFGRQQPLSRQKADAARLSSQCSLNTPKWRPHLNALPPKFHHYAGLA
jgi:hypothetical protein